MYFGTCVEKPMDRILLPPHRVLLGDAANNAQRTAEDFADSTKKNAEGAKDEAAGKADKAASKTQKKSNEL